MGMQVPRLIRGDKILKKEEIKKLSKTIFLIAVGFLTAVTLSGARASAALPADAKVIEANDLITKYKPVAVVVPQHEERIFEADEADDDEVFEEDGVLDDADDDEVLFEEYDASPDTVEDTPEEEEAKPADDARQAKLWIDESGFVWIITPDENWQSILTPVPDENGGQLRVALPGATTAK